MTCNKKNRSDGSCCVDSDINRTRINIWEPQFDQSTFLGRSRHFYKLYHPFHFFASDQKLENARRIMERYRLGDPMEDVSVNKMWKSKYLYESTFDRYTDDKLVLLGRPAGYVPWTALIGGGLLTYYQRPMPIIFWQWAFQTLQFAIRYTNRAANSRITDDQLLLGYSAGSVGAITTALLYHKLFKCSSPIVSRMGPVLAVIVANCISVPITRYSDIEEGIPIYDNNDKKLAISTVAAKCSILMETVKELLIVTPPLVIAPFYMEYLEERGTLCRYPYLTLPNQMLFLALFCTVLTPFFRALLCEKASIPFTCLQPDLQDCILKRNDIPAPKRVYFSLGI